MLLSSPAILFYAVDPREHTWATVDSVPAYTSQAIPWFILLLLLELVVSLARGHALWRRFVLKELVCSISLGIFQQVVTVPINVAQLALYVAVYARAPSIVPHDSARCWVSLFFGIDLGYYILHRFSHEFHIGWIGHSVHHTGEFYNLATALRQGVCQSIVTPFFYLPLALLGLPPPMYMTHKALNTLYQFWIHTETIGSLGPLEYVLNTPSHHLVHHHRGGEANYAGVLIIWDRLFGTFRAEGPSQRDRYGLGKPLASFDPLFANAASAIRAYSVLGHGFLLRRRLPARWQCSLRALFAPLPAGRSALWRIPKVEDDAAHGSSAAHESTARREAPLRRAKHIGSVPPADSGRAIIETGYLCAQLLITLITYISFEARLKARGSADVIVWALAAWVLLSLCSLGRLSDGDPLGVVLEWTRLLLVLLASSALLWDSDRIAMGTGASLTLLGFWAIASRGWWVVPPTIA